MIAQRALTIGELLVAFLATEFVDGQVLAQTGGCVRCGSSGIAPLGASPSRWTSRLVWREEAPRREGRKRETSEVATLGGSYTVCVRTCDGSFFPVSYSGEASRFDGLEAVCRSLCPNADVALYSFPFGGIIDQAKSSTGAPYTDLPNADRFQQIYDPGCSCRGGGQSWADALARAEARYGHRSRDILVTPEKSAQMSRAFQDLKTKSAGTTTTRGGTEMKLEEVTSPPPGLDINGVDAQLRAAAAKIGHATSGIKDDDPPSGASYGLNDGQIVQEAAPDGTIRRVRIIGPTH
jgi:hypothetical protein